MVPMDIAIRGLRRRIGANRPISVFHIDQPSNDFNALFEVLDADPDRYVLDDPNVFPAAIGKSFYENVLPPSSVHLGWSSYAAVWLSRVPALIPGHFFPASATGRHSGVEPDRLATTQNTFAERARSDFESFRLFSSCLGRPRCLSGKRFIARGLVCRGG